jgi:hypothetical protein
LIIDSQNVAVQAVLVHSILKNTLKQKLWETG